MLFLLSLPMALAWKHTGTVWTDDQIPIKWFMDDGREESLMADPDDEYDQQVIQTAWENWYVAECAAYTIDDKYSGRADYGKRDYNDGLTVFYWNDPNDEAGAGVLGVTYTLPAGTIIKIANGRTYYGVVGSDIIFNDNVDFGRTEDIEAGRCSGETAIEGVATHEIGHMWGLGHSCEQGEVCTDTAMQQATMFWSVGPCDLGQNDPNEDDIASINALYGPSATFAAVTAQAGATPLPVTFEITPSSDDVEVSAAQWYFGDGGTSTEIRPTHTYETKGQFTVSADITLSTDVCGEVTYSQSQLGMIIACEQPAPELQFPAAGTYTIVMNVGGPAGLKADQLTIEVAESSGGCNTVPMTGLAGLLAGLAALRRRR